MIYSNAFTTSYNSTYVLSTSYAGVDMVKFLPGSGGINAGVGGSGQHLVVDNIRYTLAPEPAAWMLFASGLPVFPVVMRRRLKFWKK